MNKIIVVEGWTRDLGLPKSWKERGEIWNAARPFPAHQHCVGEFLHGVFYGLIEPGGQNPELHRKRAVELDASLLEFHTLAQVEKWGKAFCEERDIDYGRFSINEIARSYIRHQKRENDDGEDN